MPRKRRPFIRESAVRDAHLIVIATEDTKATVRYFQELVSSKYYQSTKVHVEVLTRDDTASSPEHVLAQLDDWAESYVFGQGDELWVVIDVDRWGEGKLSRVAQKCMQKNFLLAVSNPDIELWFLLHLVDVESDFGAQQKHDLMVSRRTNNRSPLEQEILKIIGSYNKSNLDVDQFIPNVKVAIERAAKLDKNPNDRWPQELGTRVYLLVQSILKHT